MIKTKYLVPEVYYDRSRDFQLLGRTYDIIFNYLKTNTDTISNNPLSNDSDKKLINLVASTLGFKQLHNYNTDQLKAICSVYQLAIRNKGNLKSLQIVLDTLLHTAGIDEPIEVEIIGPVIQIMVPPELTDLTLFYDMLDYILPAGCSCQIIKQLKVTTDVTTDTVYEETYAKIGRDNYETAGIPVYNPLVQPSDVAPGRNDNMTIMGYEAGATTVLAAKTYGTTNMGSLNWYYDDSWQGTGKRFYAYITDLYNNPDSYSTSDLICDKYMPVTTQAFYTAKGLDGCIAAVGGSSPYIELRDDKYTSAAALKAALSNTILMYRKRE